MIGWQHSQEKENSQELIQINPRSHSKHLVGNKTAQYDTIRDIISDSHVNSPILVTSLNTSLISQQGKMLCHSSIEKNAITANLQ